MRKKSEIEEYEREAYSRVWLVRKQAMFWDIFEGIDSIEVEDLGYCLDKIDEVCEEYDIDFQYHKKNYYLGVYSDYNEAVRVRKEAEKKYFGDLNRRE